MAMNDVDIFACSALRQRKEHDGINADGAIAFVVGKYEPTVEDFQRLRGEVSGRRKLYAANFRDVRNKIYAHKELADRDAMNQLLAKANINDLRSLFDFLHALHEALWELFYNGRRPTVCLPYFDPDMPTPPGGDAPGEIVAREVSMFFRSLPLSK